MPYWRVWGAVHTPCWMQTSTTRWLCLFCLVLTIEVYGNTNSICLLESASRAVTLSLTYIGNRSLC